MKTFRKNWKPTTRNILLKRLREKAISTVSCDRIMIREAMEIIKSFSRREALN